MLQKNKEKNEEHLFIRFFGVTVGAMAIFIFEVAQILFIAAVIILPIRYYLVKPFVVRGASMEPNYFDSEYLIIDEISYRFRNAERGETIVFIPPNNRSQFYIKRVIGLPGEEVKIEDGVITIFNAEYPDGFDLEEEYIHEFTYGQSNIILKMDEYYVLGDNRDHSLDSRSFGVVPADNIVGRAWLRGLPIEKIGAIASPEYKINE